MLNSLPFASNNRAMNHGVCDAKYVFKEGRPFRILPSMWCESESMAVIEEEYKSKLMFALDYGTIGNTINMSKHEREAWFNFGNHEMDHDYPYKTALGLSEMDRYLVEEVMKAPDYNKRGNSSEYVARMASGCCQVDELVDLEDIPSASSTNYQGGTGNEC